MTDKAVSRWERGLGYPDYQLLEKLCEILDTPVEQLLFGSTKAPAGSTQNPTDSAEAPDQQAEAASETKPDPQAALAAAYEDAEKAYRQKRRKRRLIAAGILVLLLSAALLYRAHVQPRVCRTLLGTYTSPSGEAVPVRVELDGRLYRFLLKDAAYYGGSLVIEAGGGEAPLFSRSFAAKDSAQGLDLIGAMIDENDAYYISSCIAFYSLKYVF